MTGMSYQLKEQGNVFALVKIFNAIPLPPFSAPAELRPKTETTETLAMLILNPHLLCSRSGISLRLYSNFIPCHFGTKPNI